MIMLPKINKEGYFFICTFAVLSFIIGMFISILGTIGGVLTLWCIYFFRDPERVTPLGDNLIISPADGIIQDISEVAPPKELGMSDEPLIKISIFLNVFNVHVNRVPASGKIISLVYHPGKFFNASLDKASIHNERQSVLMQTTSGEQVAFVQIAGLIARRIICNLEDQQAVSAGERFGIIRFGSRMDVYLPKGVWPKVMVGQTAIGGETILADLTTNISLKEQTT
jgi:phosphatidylserine decarboxylase